MLFVIWPQTTLRHAHAFAFAFIFLRHRLLLLLCLLLLAYSTPITLHILFWMPKTHSLQISSVQIAFEIREREREQIRYKNAATSRLALTWHDTVCMCVMFIVTTSKVNEQTIHTLTYWRSTVQVIASLSHCLSPSLFFFGCDESFLLLLLLLRCEPDRKIGCKWRVLHDILRNRNQIHVNKNEMRKKQSFVGISRVINTYTQRPRFEYFCFIMTIFYWCLLWFAHKTNYPQK